MLIGTPSVSRLPGTSLTYVPLCIYIYISNNNMLKKFFGTKCPAKLKRVSSFIQDIVFPKLATHRNMRWSLFIAIFLIALQTWIDMTHTICNLPTPENKNRWNLKIYILGKGKHLQSSNFWGSMVFSMSWKHSLMHINTYATYALYIAPKNLAPPYKPKQYHQAVLTTNFRHTFNLLKKIYTFPPDTTSYRSYRLRTPT